MQPDAGGTVAWQPVAMDCWPAGLAPLERALTGSGQVLHDDAAAFYGSFWACRFETFHPPSDEPVLLCLAQNEEELSWLVRDLVAHVRLQVSEGRPVTIPVAGTVSDLFFALDNSTGQVVLQEFGHAPARVVSTSLAAFLSEL